ncbi:4-hydroxy-tetrahydrodipicolinate reductase [Pseudoclavibacter sp. CFCC 13796]|uniref:4-hydroxy-tetrahydrodipicolinate reductase n=1 Tax=Pseudoclavibacter sp. CFCC 13796 TaxID=2615179 RepID=UPI001300D454|nr:4-hydroxy-tetrahydrodipicolinate reductase [Pseudoclavibacter sp. CFCC 13796]KAB1661219.1 4-hydroxy-tetrahydrodipicolinate reductase [Pseudoclavibacter sp. CFCC 13796]
MTLNISVTGATGRMGRLVEDIIEHDDRFALHSTLDSHSSLSKMEGADVVVDFTIYDASRKIVDHALAHGIDVVVGTSGWNAERIAEVADRADRSSLVIVPNFSVSSALATKLAQLAAPLYDSVEVVEAHPARKKDSPSGTAVRTAELISAAHGPYAQPNTDQTARGQLVEGIPVHSLRLQGVDAVQQVIFGGTAETLTLRHDTLSIDAYRDGIARSIVFAHEQTGTTVGLADVIGL